MSNKTIPTTSFLGRGWSFPPEFEQQSGQIVMTEDEADIEASLKVLLATTAGERILNPKYGLNLQHYLFEPMTTTMQSLLKDRMNTAILIYEARISVLEIELDTSNLNAGQLIFSIDYVVRATNSRFNLVYPFYLHDGNEVSSAVGAG